MLSAESGVRDYDAEARDLPGRRYAYSFDYLMHAYMMRVFEPYFGGADALELGCFRGEFTKRIAKRFPCVTVVDGSLTHVTTAVEGVTNFPGRRHGVQGTFEEVTLPRQNYDAIFLIHTLEHIDDAQLVLRRCASWLRPDGKLFLAVPNAHAASRQIAEKMGLIKDCYEVTEGERVHGHRRTYSLGTLTDEVMASGLTVLERGGIMFKPMANFQMDRALQSGVIDMAYLNGCFELGKIYPEMCASVYAVCAR